MLIVIGTSPGRTEWASEASASISRDHIVVSSFGYELNKIRFVVEETKAERFLLLQDSWVVKSDEFWDLLDTVQGSVALSPYPYFYGCYAGVYESWAVREVGIPVVQDKDHSIRLEVDWHRQYVDVAGEPTVLFPDLVDANATGVVMKHGRENLVLENDLIAKYKGTWTC